MTSKPDESKTEYRYLDPIGLRVSVASLDIWGDNTSEQLKVGFVKFLLEHDINFLYKANAYGTERG